jgi:hydroxymethylglutaryl-CoA lyase
MVTAGVKHLEYTSFVSPKAIPQLADAKEVTDTVLKKYPGLDVFALVPNLRGAQSAYDLGLKKVVYVVSLSVSHNKANINRTHEQSLDAYKEIKQSYPDMNIIVDLATAFGCPFEGKNEDSDRVVSFVKDYVDAGMKTCCLCDTIGIADPKQTKLILGAVMKAFPALELMVHFHDTRGLGMVNTLTAIQMGIDKVQGALGGLGGCPFAPGASGNLATEDLVWMLNEMGYETGVSFEQLLLCAKHQVELISGEYSGHQIHIKSK